MNHINHKCTGICETCNKCKGAKLLQEVNERKTKDIVLPTDFVTDEYAANGFGFAFDIGTTTLVGVLWDLDKINVVDAIAKTNPQTIFGADVISRIHYCGNDDEKLKEIRGVILDGLNEIIAELSMKHGIDKNSIVKISIAGNTTMSHIFAGFDPMPLALSPFTPAYTGEKCFTAAEIPFDVKKDTEVILLPNIAGHVGGDITAGILATRLLKKKGLTLFLDIGTNGEIVLTENDRIMACSTAAGPAFEGAAIYQGMRAAAGAIEKIKIAEGELFIQTVGQYEPIGICGSGIIDALAQMIQVGIVNEKGNLLMPDEIKDADIDKKILKRLRRGKQGKEFVLVWKEGTEDIVITQKDIREVQLAKGAICAGIHIMLAEIEKKAEDIDELILAGAFGNYIDKKSAVLIGLLPKIDPWKILSGGNTACTGTSLVLFSKEERQAASSISNQVQHIELATCRNFQEEYMKAMFFPKF